MVYLPQKRVQLVSHCSISEQGTGSHSFLNVFQFINTTLSTLHALHDRTCRVYHSALRRRGFGWMTLYPLYHKGDVQTLHLELPCFFYLWGLFSFSSTTRLQLEHTLFRLCAIIATVEPLQSRLCLHFHILPEERLLPLKLPLKVEVTAWVSSQVVGLAFALGAQIGPPDG